MKQSIKPVIWGPHGWKFMHYVTMGYPDNPNPSDKQNYKEFFMSLRNILPCAKCAQNYKKNLNEYPIDNHLESRDNLVKWLIDIHNKVNLETGKEIIPYEEALSLYTKAETPLLIDYCFKLSVLLIILYFLYLILKK
tara:strand:+ start:1963 stop:2373 length:411 start_codon:yes stop_codon:yes gene_type:complete